MSTLLHGRQLLLVDGTGRLPDQKGQRQHAALRPHSHVWYMSEERSSTSMHTRLFRTGMQGSAEGNPGTTQDLAQVFTPLTCFAGPNRAWGLASGGSASMRRREKSP